jgi:hypothetical protein
MMRKQMRKSQIESKESKGDNSWKVNIIYGLKCQTLVSEAEKISKN